MGDIHLGADNTAEINYGFLIDLDDGSGVFFVCDIPCDSFPDYLVRFSCHSSCHHNIDVFIRPVHNVSLLNKDSEFCAKCDGNYNT